MQKAKTERRVVQTDGNKMRDLDSRSWSVLANWLVSGLFEAPEADGVTTGRVVSGGGK